MELTFASYNIHKAVGLDRRRDPERIMAVLHEIDADIIALQEADRRLGARVAAIPPALIDHSKWALAPLARRPQSIGWHGNALLVRRDLPIIEAHPLDLPTLEPRGAVMAEIDLGPQKLRVIGAHLDISGFRRRAQIREMLGRVARSEAECPTVIMGDFNQWGIGSGAMREFREHWTPLAPGPSYPSRRPITRFDRIVLSQHCQCLEHGVHHSALSGRASDHLPIFAKVRLPSK